MALRRKILLLDGFWPKVFNTLLLLFVYGAAHTQVAYHNFSSNDGLPSNEVYCVYQDKLGYMWFGTDHGVVRYDGYKFKTYTTQDGLTDNTVFSIKGDNEGNVWFLTFTGGICYYSRAGFRPHPLNDSIIGLTRKRIPTSWEVLGNKTIWLGFIESGFYKVEENKITAFINQLSNEKPNNGSTTYIIEFDSLRFVYSTVYAGDIGKIKDPGVKKQESVFLSLSQMPFRNINYTMALLKNGNLIMGVANSLIYLSGRGIINTIHLQPDAHISAITQTADNKVWVCIKNSKPYSLSFSENGVQLADSLTNWESISYISSDNQQNYWATSLNNGVYFMPDTKIRIWGRQPENPVSSKFMYLQLINHSLYISLPKNKIIKLDKGFNEKVITGIESANAVSGLIFKNKKLISNIDLSSQWTGRSYKFSFMNAIEDLGEQGILTAGETGFEIINARKLVFSSKNIGFTKRVTAVKRIKGSLVAIGTISGLYYFDETRHTLVNDSIIAKTRITACASFNDSVYAIATRGLGVAIYYGQRPYFINDSCGLISNLAENLYFENDSTLWVATYKGLSRTTFCFNQNNFICSIKSYTKEDGLCSNQVNAITGFNGYIWLATNEGLCYFHPQDLPDDTLEIPFYFGEVKVNGSPEKLNGASLNYDQNNIVIGFNALYFKAISGIRYKLRLHNNDTWKYTDQNYVEYFNLPPGDYEVQVAADDKFGKYKSTVHSIRFTIKPKFTDTLLFKTISGAFIALIVFVIFFGFYSYQKLKATNLIKLLQAEFKALSYQINPHFIFNVLNSIQYYILRKESDSAVHLLSSFSMLIRRIVNNSRQQYISVLEEVECLREYLELEKLRLDDKFEYEINIDTNIHIEEKIILPMIIQPLVENSIWHGIAPSGRMGKITVNFSAKNGQVICTVEDNGVGIHAKKEGEHKTQNNLSLAMKNVSERLKIISELNNSTWAIKTEDKSENNPGETGTRVTIIFPHPMKS
ncbi:MAG TPA: histidine kinase [Chitinophagales bacterium]|nr:histidine kinase [Chitinophagales bacterium]